MDIKKIRTEFGYTQQTLADELGVSKNTVLNWEAGKTIPSTKIKAIEQFVEQKRASSKPTTNLSIEESLKFLIESNNRIEASLSKLGKQLKK